jgi:hypothetical protein
MELERGILSVGNNGYDRNHLKPRPLIIVFLEAPAKSRKCRIGKEPLFRHFDHVILH